MPGVPTSRGCEACRKQKKKCNQIKPKCGRCTRLKIPCIGNGARRWIWRQSEMSVSTPRPSPSNESTRENSKLVFILGIEDLRYDMRAYGGTFYADLPRRFGHSPVLDASVSALVASYNACQFNQSKIKALELYGSALGILRTSLQQSTESMAVKMYAIYNIYVCQDWIDRKNKHSGKHMEMLALMLQDVVAQGKLNELDYVYGLCQYIIWQSLVSPRVKLGPWFWKAASICTTTRPLRYQRHDFLSLELGTRAEASLYLHAPTKHLYQIKCIYDLIRLEKPRLHQTVERLRMAAFAPKATLMEMRVLISYLSGYATLLAMGAIINRVLRTFEYECFGLLEEAHDFCDETILLATRCASHRPLGAAYVPEILKIVWASSTDNYGRAELEALLLDFQTDFDGADYLAEAMSIRGQFEKLERSVNQTKFVRKDIFGVKTGLNDLEPAEGCVPQ